MTDLFDCKNFFKFAKSIVEDLNFSGFSQSKFYICKKGNIEFLTKVMFYRKSPPELYLKKYPKHMIHQTDAEIKILWLFKKQFIDTGITPCILEILHSTVCKLPKTLDYAGKDETVRQFYSTIKEFSDLAAAGLARNKCAFMVTEYCDMTLYNYLNNNVIHHSPIHFSIFKTILFQIIYTIFAIKSKYPQWVHFDLHMGNIMLKFDYSYKFCSESPQYLVFHVIKSGKKTSFAIPYFGIFAKIIDFGFSVVPEKDIISDAIIDRDLMYWRHSNDLIVLFHNISIVAKNYSKITGLLHKLEPNGLFVEYDMKKLEKNYKKIPSCEEMLFGGEFNVYIKDNIPAGQIYAEYQITI